MRYASRSASSAFETIVVATDFSEFAERALYRTIGLARQFHSTIVLTHIIDPVVYSHALNGAPFVLRQIEHDVKEQLESSAEVLRRERIPYDLVVREGIIRDSLYQMVQDRSADLLVVSTHGEHRFDRNVCSSVAEKILRVAPCPVMVMGPVACPTAPPASGPQRLLFATGFSANSLHTLPFVDAFAHLLDAEIHLLHVYPEATSKPQATRECLERLEQVARTHLVMTPTVHCLVQTGGLGEAIASVASSIDARAIILGVQQEDLTRKPLGGLHHGLVYRIVTRTCCPVITLHSGLDVRSLRIIASAEERHPNGTVPPQPAPDGENVA